MQLKRIRHVLSRFGLSRPEGQAQRPPGLAGMLHTANNSRFSWRGSRLKSGHEFLVLPRPLLASSDCPASRGGLGCRIINETERIKDPEARCSYLNNRRSRPPPSGPGRSRRASMTRRNQSWRQCRCLRSIWHDLYPPPRSQEPCGALSHKPHDRKGTASSPLLAPQIPPAWRSAIASCAAMRPWPSGCIDIDSVVIVLLLLLLLPLPDNLVARNQIPPSLHSCFGALVSSGLLRSLLGGTPLPDPPPGPDLFRDSPAPISRRTPHSLPPTEGILVERVAHTLKPLLVHACPLAMTSTLACSNARSGATVDLTTYSDATNNHRWMDSPVQLDILPPGEETQDRWRARSQDNRENIRSTHDKTVEQWRKCWTLV